MDLRAGSVTVYAQGAAYYAHGDFDHCPEADIRYNIAVLTRQLASKHRRPDQSAWITKDHDVRLYYYNYVDWLKVWQHVQLYKCCLYHTTPTGELLQEASWAIDPTFGIRPCAADDTRRVIAPVAASCPACDATITPVLTLDSKPSSSRHLLWEWKCLQFDRQCGHLHRREYLDVPLSPPKRTHGAAEETNN
jgi:hypothetical protein